MSNDILGEVRRLMPSLSNSEKRVANAVLEEPEKMIYWSVNDLGERAKAGDATVLRFCRKLGLSGYQEFKLLVAQSLPAEGSKSEDDEADEPDQQLAFIRKTRDINMLAIQDTTELTDIDALKQAAELMTGARRVHFYGVGASGLTAADAKLRFMRIGIPCDYMPDPHIQVMDAALLTPDDVAFGITYSGSTKDMLEIIKTAKDRGARTIVLTGHNRSPIIDHTDIALYTSSKETPLLGGAFVTKIAQIHLLDLLFSLVAERARARTEQASQLTAKAVLRKLFESGIIILSALEVTDLATCLAMDLGGTKSLLGLVDADGVIRYSERKPSVFPIRRDSIIDELAAWVRHMETKGRFDRIGIGMAGQVDGSRGLLMSTCLSDEVLDVSVAERLSEATGYPVVMDNDGLAALIGERWKGSAPPEAHVVMLTIGTGLGGAAWDRDRPLKGSRGAALHVGHLVFQYDGIACSCGNRGCAEKYISGTGIREAYERLTGRSVPAETVYALYRSGEDDAASVVRTFLNQCASLIAGLANTLNPTVFLLGGGVSESLTADDLDAAERGARAMALPANRHFRLVKAALGNEAGMIGAACMALDARSL